VNARIVDGEALAKMAGEWELLLADSAGDVPTLSPAWQLAWAHAFGRLDGRKLRALVLFDGAKLVGLCTFVARVTLHKRLLPFRRLELGGSGEPVADEICSDYIGPIAARGREEEVAAETANAIADGRLGAWDELVLPALDGSLAMPSLLTGALRRAGVEAICAPTTPAPYIPLPSSFEAYLKRLSSENRRLVNKSLRDFEAWAGAPAELQLVEREAQLADGWRILTSLHGERWSARRDGGVFGSSRFARFHLEVMQALLRRGALELSWLSAHGEPIAALYNLVWNGRVHFYQSGRKLEVPKQIRPGIVAHACAIRRAIALGRREYDFLAGTAQYKRQLATAERPIVAIRATRAPLREGARRLIDRLQTLRRV
jgi:CelD/BcsL family acetyltransferase involved in cellulose biosynthesis